MGPGMGRDKTPESIADEIMNQSDEGVDDLLEGTEVYEGEDAESDDNDSYSEITGDLDYGSDAGGDDYD